MKIKNKILNNVEKFLFVLYVANRLSTGTNPLTKIRLLETFMDEMRKIDRKYKLKDLYEDMRYCKKMGYLDFKYSRRNGFFFNFTKKGIIKLLNKEPLLNRKKWEKISGNYKSMVFFDIPEVLRHKRDGFRKILKLMGYEEIQRSVFVGEYDNFEDVNFIVAAMDLQEYVRIGYFKEKN